MLWSLKKQGPPREAGSQTRTARPSRSRSPRRSGSMSTGRPGQRTSDDPRENEHEDETSFMHRGTRNDSREGSGEGRRHRRDEGPDRDRSRTRWTEERGGGREERVRERLTRETRETRRLTPATCWTEGGGGWRDRGMASKGSEPASASTATRRPPERAEGEMDILLVIMGLRNSGEEQLEPANAITMQRQARARSMLTSLSDKDLNTMIRALLRLTRMIYIEAARMVTQVQDARRRNMEMIEVEIEEDDDESIYMQSSMFATRNQP